MAKNTKKTGNAGNQKTTSEKARARAEQMYAQRKAEKKTAKSAKKPEKKEKKQGYWKGVKTEMGKVVWPTRKELGVYTGIVVVVCAICAVAFWAIDTGVLAAFRGLIS